MNVKKLQRLGGVSAIYGKVLQTDEQGFEAVFASHQSYLVFSVCKQTAK
jgi:hypothetical protein